VIKQQLTERKQQLTKEDIKDLAEADLLTFAKLVNPQRMYGKMHEELFRWWQAENASDNQLVLLPRDHQKSHCIATRVAWEITRDPSLTVLYISATADLAEKQLYAIKNILTSKTYRRYWPNMVEKEEGKRERWTVGEISLDHPVRKREGVRDPTIKAAGLTTNVTGFHCNIAVLDDVVVPGNAYTGEGRDKVAGMYSQLASIQTTGAKEWVVGTRYHPKDLYTTLLEMVEEEFDDDGEVIDFVPVYDIFQKVVEIEGEFLWPRQRRKDGKFFGFDLKQLARKKAKYVDRVQFYAQYYNDPFDPDNQRISYDVFQYYDRNLISLNDGSVHFKGNKLNVFAAIDFAFSVRKGADYTAIVVIGVDGDNIIYVLDINRFQTTSIKEMFDAVLNVYSKWDFTKLRAEVSVGQKAIVQEFKEYMRQYGVFFSIDEHRPTRYQGTKEERMASILEPRYENMAVWHYKGGNIQLLEEELIETHPAHDDIKDALTSAIEVSKPPARRQMNRKQHRDNVFTHARFGGIAV